MNIKMLSIIVPEFNERKTIKTLIKRLERLDLGEIKKEIVFVDDGSTDGSSKILRNSIETKIIFLKKNHGKGYALRKGFNVAKGDTLVIQDSDLEYNPVDLKKMLKHMSLRKLDILYGSRMLNKDFKPANAFFYWGGKLVNLLTNVLYSANITDEATCYKMFRREVLDKIKLESTGFEFCPEFTAKVLKKGYKIYETPISYNPRTPAEGKKIKLKDGIIAIYTLLKYRLFS